MSAKGKVFIDTNVLVYLFDRDAPEKQRRARAVIEREQANLTLSPQVLQEFFVTVTRKLQKPMSEADAETALRHLAAFDVVPADATLVLQAVGRCRRDKVAFWDALIVESALAGHCERLFSEDLQDGRRFGELTVVNPFV
jgi:predicted nucleic acid-binding protein